MERQFLLAFNQVFHSNCVCFSMQAVHPEGMWEPIFIQWLLAPLLSTGYSRLPIICTGMGTFRGQLWASEPFPSVATFTLLKALVQWTVLAPRPREGTEWPVPILPGVAPAGADCPYTHCPIVSPGLLWLLLLQLAHTYFQWKCLTPNPVATGPGARPVHPCINQEGRQTVGPTISLHI